MKHFSAQYIFTNTGSPLKRGIISVNDDGIICKVEDTGGSLSEKKSVEFHNGIIIPGFVNCHCHLELSHMKDLIPPGTGLALGSLIAHTGAAVRIRRTVMNSRMPIFIEFPAELRRIV